MTWLVGGFVTFVLIFSFGFIKDMTVTLVSVWFDHRQNKKLRDEDTR